ncbi:MAG: response regulator transcription factor [Prevotella sp.]
MKKDIKWENITERELEVLELLSRGYNSKDIAERLFISPNTVDYHRRLLLKKTESRNIAELIGNAYRLGIL